MADEIKIVGLANPKRSTGVSMKIVGAIIGVVVLALGVIAGIYLVGEQQDVRERAATQCPGIEACPSGDDPALLINCTPSETQSFCNTVFLGRLEMCGGVEYCCNGTSWTSNLASCAVSTPSPTPSPTVAPTEAPTASAVPTATTTTNIISSTSTPTSAPTTVGSNQQATSVPTTMPIPETWGSWTTILGAGLGVLVVVGSLILAF